MEEKKSSKLPFEIIEFSRLEQNIDLWLVQALLGQDNVATLTLYIYIFIIELEREPKNENKNMSPMRKLPKRMQNVSRICIYTTTFMIMIYTNKR